MSHKPSPYQQAIYNALITTTKNIAISATAGSGKTHTLLECAKLLPYGKSSIFIAFNKHIVEELKSKLPQNVQAKTMHSLGFQILRANYGNVSLNDKKQIGFIEPLFPNEETPKKKWKKVYTVDKLMSLARASMVRPIKDDLERLCELHALDVDNEEVSATIKAMRKFEEYTRDADYNLTADFQDFISIVALHDDIKVPKFDYVLIDEGQDMSKIDRLFLNKLVKPVTGRKIICGDGRQAIYSWRGADINSFREFSNEPNTITLPLTVSYRCAKAVVRAAKKVYPEIEECEENEEGEERKGELSEITEKDLVICRNNRPLIEVFFHLLDNNKRGHIVGKEVEEGLLGMLSSLSRSDSTKIFKEFEKREKDKIIHSLEVKGIKNYKKHPRYAVIEEKLSILQRLFERFNTVEEVENFITEIFDEDREGTRLMTIHKAKGGECDRVFVIERFEGKDLIPNQYAVTEEQLIAEENLRFVSKTRSKKSLIYLDL